MNVLFSLQFLFCIEMEALLCFVLGFCDTHYLSQKPSLYIIGRLYICIEIFRGTKLMKKTKLLLSLFTLSLFSLSSCDLIPTSSTTDTSTSSSGETSSSQEAETYLAIETLPTLSYSQYDAIDLSGLKVGLTKDGVTFEEVSDYTLMWTETNSTVATGDYLYQDPGLHAIQVSYQDYTPVSFNIVVYASTEFQEILSVTEKPSIYSYDLESEDTLFSTDGMVITLNTIYYDVNNNRQQRTETIDKSEVTFYLNEISTDTSITAGYDLAASAKGSHVIYLTYASVSGKELTASFTIFLRSGSTSPQVYNDTTITTPESDLTRTITITNDDIGEGSDEYYSPDQIGSTFDIADYRLHNYYNWRYTPTIGQVPLLVVPVVMAGYEDKATEEYHDLISKTFFGNSSDLHFESVHSYYYKSSYGQLDFTGTVTEWFNPVNEGYTQFSSISAYEDSNGMITFINAALEWLEKTGYDLTEYDSDKDGNIDGIWFINTADVSSASSTTWAYTSTTGGSGTVDNPAANCFAWASVNFLDDSYYKNSYQIDSLDNEDADAHVLIHETGHMLGANDYYSYSGTSYSPLGNSDMMNRNHGDQNPYTKLLFGWVKPYVVYGNATITLKPSFYKDQLIIIPYNTKTYTKNSNGLVNFNTYDEYLIVDFYNYTSASNDLNTQGYDCYSASANTGTGVRLYHVDNRLTYINNNYPVLFSNPDDAMTSTAELLALICNTESGTRAESYYLGNSVDYDEVRLITANNSYLNSNSRVSQNSLFSGQNNQFDIVSYKSQFPQTTAGGRVCMNIGQLCTFEFTVSE